MSSSTSLVEVKQQLGDIVVAIDREDSRAAGMAELAATRLSVHSGR